MTLPRIEEFPTVADFMDTRRIALKPDDDILDAVSYLLSHQVTGAPVVDDDHRPLGVLGERNCLRLLTEGANGELPEGTVKDFMRIDFQVVRPEMDIFQSHRQYPPLFTHGVGRIGAEVHQHLVKLGGIGDDQ